MNTINMKISLEMLAICKDELSSSFLQVIFEVAYIYLFVPS